MGSRIAILLSATALAAAVSAQEPVPQPPAPTASPAPAAATEDAPAPAAGPAAPHASRLQGKVYLGRNRNVTGAVVRVQKDGDAGRVWLTSTDDKGVFRVDALPDGSYGVRVEREGLEPVDKSGVTLKFPFRAVVELVMKPLAAPVPVPASEAPSESASMKLRLSGVVRDLALDALAEARVRVVDPTGRTDPRVATTGADGTFGFDDLAPGDWSIYVRGVGRLPIRLRLALGGDTAVDAMLVQQPATYVPSPFELMPSEEPVVPQAFLQPEVRTAK
jgi:carboxypeptidase family protein